MRLEGLPGGYPRKPALPLDKKERKTLEDLLKKTEEPL
jgi:dihydrodipicolinate synthase/N-acetylneuraminate lyase